MLKEVKLNLERLTYLAYLMFFILGFTTTLFGVTLIDICTTYQVDPYIIGYILALLPIGSTAAMPMSGWLLDRKALKPVLMAALFIMFSSISIMIAYHQIALFAGCMLILGVSNGMIISIANYIIVHLYNNQERPARLNLLNFCYSFGAVTAPLMSGSFAHLFPWQFFFTFALLLLLVVAGFSLTTKFNVVRESLAQHPPAVEEAWAKSVYIIGTALFFYVLSEYIVVNWAAAYFRQNLSMTTESASLILFFFFILMAIGRFFSGIIVQYLKVERYLLLCSTLAVLSFIGLLTAHAYLTMLLTAAVMGFSYAGIYASLLSYGTQQLSRPSSKLITFLITTGSTGGITGLFLSGLVTQFSGVLPCLIISMTAMSLVTFAVLWVRSLSTASAYPDPCKKIS